MKPKKKGYHRHHIIPKYMGGDDSDENLVYLTPKEHALAHLELYEKYQNYEDAAAFNILTKQWLEGRTISGYKQSAEHVAKRQASTDYEAISAKTKGCVGHTLGKIFGPRPEQWRKNISDGNKGKKVPEERKQRISESLKGNIPWNYSEIYCIFCHKKVSFSRLDRHGPGKKQCLTFPPS